MRERNCKIIWKMFPFWMLLIGMALLGSLMLPPVLNLLTKNHSSVLALLRGYRMQHIGILVISVLQIVLVIVGSVISIKRGSVEKDSVKLICVSLLLAVLVPFFMITRDDVFGLIAGFGEDIAQIEQGATEQAVVRFSANTYPDRLSALIPEESVTRYGGIGDDTEHQWKDFYVMDTVLGDVEIGFYDDMQSIDWNNTNTPAYKIAYTTNLRLITEIQPLSNP